MKNKKSIVIIEDEIYFSLLMDQLLTFRGYNIIGKFSDGISALNYLKKNTPDLVIADIHLSGEMSGVDVAQQITALKKVPFLFITGYQEKSILDEAEKFSCVPCLIKPITNEVFFDSIEKVIN